MNANTLLKPFCPSLEPDAPQVTMTSAIRLVNRFFCVYFVSILVKSLPICLHEHMLLDQTNAVCLILSFLWHCAHNYVAWFINIILSICWYQRVSNYGVWWITEQPPLTSIILKRYLMLFGHLVRMDESTDARRIFTAVPQSHCKRPSGHPHTSWRATMKDDLSSHSVEDATELALDRPLWRLLAASGDTNWNRASWTMMMMMMMMCVCVFMLGR